MGRPSRDITQRVLNRIEALRQELGLSRGQLADRVGVHYQTMGYLERGEYNPSLELALKLCGVLGRTVEEVFWLETDRERSKTNPRKTKSRS